MDGSSSSQSRVKVVRLVARVLSIVIILLFGIVFIPEFTGRIGLTAPPPGGLPPLSMVDAIQFYSMFVILIGLGIAWKWELVGSLITIIPMVIDGILNPRALMVVLVIAAPAILFLLCWWWSRSSRSAEARVSETDSTAPPPSDA